MSVTEKLLDHTECQTYVFWVTFSVLSIVVVAYFGWNLHMILMRNDFILVMVAQNNVSVHWSLPKLSKKKTENEVTYDMKKLTELISKNFKWPLNMAGMTKNKRCNKMQISFKPQIVILHDLFFMVKIAKILPFYLSDFCYYVQYEWKQLQWEHSK